MKPSSDRSETEVSFCRGAGEEGQEFRVRVEKRDGSRFAVQDTWASRDEAVRDARAMANDPVAVVVVEEINQP